MDVHDLLRANLAQPDPARQKISTSGYWMGLLDEAFDFEKIGETYVSSQIGNRLTINAPPKSRNNVVIIGDVKTRPIQITFIGSNNLVIVGRSARYALNIFCNGDNALFFSGLDAASTGLTVSLSSGRSVILGDGCFTSTQTKLETTDSHGVFKIDTLEQINSPRSIHLEPFVWLGRDVTVMKGQTIGHGSIVGSGAIVTAPIEPFTVNVGVPARTISRGTTWSPHESPTRPMMEKRVAMIRETMGLPLNEPEDGSNQKASRT